MNIRQFQQLMWDLFQSISHGFDGTLRMITESKGITMTQMRILIEIKHRGKSTVGDLANAIGSAPGNSSAMCKTLEKKGLVSRNRNPEDERMVLIALTDQGKALLQEINTELTDKCDPVLEDYSSTEYEQIITGINKLQEVMDSLHHAFERNQRR